VWGILARGRSLVKSCSNTDLPIAPPVVCTGTGWRWQCKEFCNLYSLSNIVWVIQWRWDEWAVGEMRNACIMFTAKHEGRYHLKDIGKGGRTILECMLKKYVVKMWASPMVCFYEHDNEPLDSINVEISWSTGVLWTFQGRLCTHVLWDEPYLRNVM
jgi:hypothetical protein